MRHPIVESLLASGATLETEGSTALCCACSVDNVEVATSLISARADVKRRDWDMDSPLLIAASMGSRSMVRLLLRNAADASQEDAKGRGPIERCFIDSSIGPVISLLRAGATVRPYTENFHLLHQAAERGSLNWVTCLVRARASPQARDELGHLPLDVALRLSGFERRVDEESTVAAAVMVCDRAEFSMATALMQLWQQPMTDQLREQHLRLWTSALAMIGTFFENGWVLWDAQPENYGVDEAGYERMRFLRVATIQEKSCDPNHAEGQLLYKIMKRFCGATVQLLTRGGSHPTWQTWLQPLFQTMCRRYFGPEAVDALAGTEVDEGPMVAAAVLVCDRVEISMTTALLQLWQQPMTEQLREQHLRLWTSALAMIGTFFENGWVLRDAQPENYGVDEGDYDGMRFLDAGAMERRSLSPNHLEGQLLYKIMKICCRATVQLLTSRDIHPTWQTWLQPLFQTMCRRYFGPEAAPVWGDQLFWSRTGACWTLNP
ncbi:ANK1 [Symbiodinium sp. CCMP2592]|nr:ANK1 [Symbiodinium sp. CCMP2592]